MDRNRQRDSKSYSYKTRKEKIHLRIVDGLKEKPMLDGMDSICASKGEEAVRRARYYDGYSLKTTDPLGTYTGIPSEGNGEMPVQDADDL